MPRSSVALGNLRGVVIVIVLAFHAVLAYLASQPAKAPRFDEPPYPWQAFPILDSHRWFGFDLFCAWQDVSLMAMMFFLSGLFVLPSLRRKGAWTYVSDRLWRIGVPFVLAVLLLMPLAYYAAYRVTALDPSLAAFWTHWLALPFWPCGPQWFLWQLLILSGLAAALHRLAPRWSEGLASAGAWFRDRPIHFFAALVGLSALAYVPLALATSPWDWQNAGGPFSFQVSRPLHYLVYFFAGLAIGGSALDRGLLAANGALARQWAGWLVVAVAAWVLWAWPTSMTLGHWSKSPISIRLAASVAYTVACAAGCLFLIAICLRFARERNWALESLSSNSYGMYLVHYVFVVWLQYAMLDLALPAFIKAAVVFAGTLALSWAGAAAFGSISLGSLFVTAKRETGGA